MASNNSINSPNTVNTLVAGTGSSNYTAIAYSATGGTSNIVSRNSSGNTASNSYIPGYATTVTAATTTTLTVASAQQQFFTGSTTQTVVLPVVSTLVLGQSFEIVNNSSGVVTVQSSGANTIQAMAASTVLHVTVIAITGTSAASWSAEYTGAGVSGITTLSGNSGSASGSTVTISANAGESVVFTASGSTSTLTLSDGAVNTFLGSGSGTGALTGDHNTAIGVNSLNILTSGNHNNALGVSSLGALLTGAYNIALGYSSGDTYVSSESSNILLNSSGIIGDSNTLRIGDSTGSSNKQLNKAFISGINGVTVSNPKLLYINSSTDQLGVNSSLITAPAASSTVTSGFGSSLTAGTAVQNTLGYDILINIVVSASLATAATIVLGVGATSTPTTNTVIPTFTLAALNFYTFSAVVPSNYYVLVNTTGTITVASITVQAMGI